MSQLSGFSNLSTGVIVGISVGSAVAVALIILVIVLVCRRKRETEEPERPIPPFLRGKDSAATFHSEEYYPPPPEYNRYQHNSYDRQHQQV